MGKVIISGSEAREKVFEGIDELYNAVSSTLGPHGSSVIIEKLMTNPIITKDGVTVAREINFSDPYKNLGVQLMQQVATKTDQLVGDGTTTSTILAHDLYKCCINYLDADPSKKLNLLNTLDEVEKVIIERIDEDAIKITTDEQLNNVALISCNSDQEIAKLIINAFKKAGPSLNIQVDINSRSNDDIKVSDGMVLFTGFCSPHFINQKSVSECVLEEPFVYITEDNLLSTKDAAKILNLAIDEKKKSIIVFCPVCAGEALQTFIVNKERGICDSCVVTYPQFGVIRSELIEDISAVTGASSVSLAQGHSIQASTSKDLGKLKRCVVTANKCNLIRCDDYNTDKINKIISDIKEKLTTCNIAEAPKYSMRLDRLCGTIVEILVGGNTEVEVKERKDRVIDAIGAVRAALEEGIIVGAGKELANISNGWKLNESCVDFPLISEVLAGPFLKILESSNIIPTPEQEEIMIASSNKGFNAYTREFGNLFDLGVVDPAKVTKTAVRNAFSVVKILINTNAVIINKS